MKVQRLLLTRDTDFVCIQDNLINCVVQVVWCKFWGVRRGRQIVFIMHFSNIRNIYYYVFNFYLCTVCVFDIETVQDFLSHFNKVSVQKLYKF